MSIDQYSDRQRREVEYHRGRAQEHQYILQRPFNWDVLNNPGRRWWNAYWQMYAYLVTCALAGKKVLVVGCGFGEDALRIAKLGAAVSAFDLSPDSLKIARALAEREGVAIDFDEMPAEKLRYKDSTFDYVIARDILHHVDIQPTMAEIQRVLKPNGVFVADEIYSHSITDRVRGSNIVAKHIYPSMTRFVYGEVHPYITADERKLTEFDIKIYLKCLRSRCSLSISTF